MLENEGLKVVLDVEGLRAGNEDEIATVAVIEVF